MPDITTDDASAIDLAQGAMIMAGKRAAKSPEHAARAAISLVGAGGDGDHDDDSDDSDDSDDTGSGGGDGSGVPGPPPAAAKHPTPGMDVLHAAPLGHVVSGAGDSGNLSVDQTVNADYVGVGPDGIKTETDSSAASYTDVAEGHVNITEVEMVESREAAGDDDTDVDSDDTDPEDVWLMNFEDLVIVFGN